MADTKGSLVENSSYFSRQQLLLGADGQQALKEAHIVVVGAGGLGCSVLAALGRAGIGVIDIVDGDEVALSNLHRQILFLHEDIGSPKALAAAKHLRSGASHTQFNSHCCWFEEYAAKSIKGVDLIIDATDNSTVRSKIATFAKSQSIPWIMGAVEEFHGQVALFEKRDYATLPQTNSPSKAIAAPMVMQVASLQANLALRYLSKMEVASDLLYYLGYSKGEFAINKFKL